ncbi:MAG: DUF547 domain-containing protein [Verrucomicrobiota bacterium]|nr:DUF547 domain-containing protein [Verrucomicrobiota bacterium]
MKLSKCFGILVLGLAVTFNGAASGTKKQSGQTAKTSKADAKDGSQAEEGLVQVPKNIAHSSFDQLLKKYVNEKGLVNYTAWKASTNDMAALRQYTENFSAREPVATGPERIASLINAYNAFVLRTILDSYPTESIWELKEPFKGKRWQVGGQTISVEDIEHQTLRPLAGYRVHAAMVCAARSCPPLSRDAYREEVLDKQLDEAMRRWLARPDLNNFDAQKKEAHLSSVFKWFKEDFNGKDESVLKIISKYAPPENQNFLKQSGVKLDYLEYNWGLNDQGDAGKNYHRGLLKKFFR